MKRVALKSGQEFVLTDDGVRINEIAKNSSNDGISQVTLPSGKTSKIFKHNPVREIWYIISGNGELWSKNYSEESVRQLVPGVAVEIPLGVEFQYKSSTNSDLIFTQVTMPKWPEVQRT